MAHQRHLGRPGNTIPAAAAALGWSERILRNAVAAGDVRVTRFAGLDRVSDAELDRLRRLFSKAEDERQEPVDAPA